MLVLTRKPGQLLLIQPQEREICKLTVGEVFASGPMEILVGKVDGQRVRLGIKAHRGLWVVRAELEGTEVWDKLNRRLVP